MKVAIKRASLLRSLLLCALALAGALSPLASPPALVSAQARWVVKLGTSARSGSPLEGAMSSVADAIEHAHANRFWVKRFSDAALVHATPSERAQAALERVAKGEVHGYAASFDELVQAAPDLAVLGAPFLFDDVAAARKALRGRLSGLIGDVLAAKGLHLLTVGACDTRELLSAERSLTTPKELAGLRVARGATPGHAAFAAALSMTPSDEAAPDVRDATLTELLASPSAQAARHLMLTEHAIECGAVVLSQRWLDGLPEQLRKSVERMPKDIGADATDAQLALRPKLIEHAKAIGLQVHTPSASERRAYVAATRDAYDVLLKGTSDLAAKLVFAARNP